MARRITLSAPASVRSDDGADLSDLAVDYAGDLNEQQRAAATAPGGPLLVVAGAGTGKTRTLIYRLAYLVETGARPEEIVLLTFTRRAAREMTTRAAALLDGRCRRAESGTFHAFCLRLLRRHAPRIDFPRRFTVLDSADAADVCSVLRAAGDYHKGEERFPGKKALQRLFSACTNRRMDLAEALEEKYPQFAHFERELRELQRAYGAYKRRHGLMDFDDLLARTLELFRNHDDVRREVAGGCRHVLVDEYQDTNPLQADLVKQFASAHGSVTAVGDDAQSIYRFRGADFRNIFRFPERYDGAQVLKLEQNYRSTQPILDLANRLIDEAHRSYDKALFTDKAEGDPPALVPADDDRTEARFVTQMVLRMREQGVPLDEMAVLFRSGHNAYEVEIELGRAGIPFVKYGGMKLSEAAHIKDVVAHLKVAENPQDAAAWNRALQLLGGIGPKTAKDLIEQLAQAARQESGEPLAFREALSSPRYEQALRRLLGMLRRLRNGNLALSEQVEAAIDYYAPILEDKHAEDHPKRQRDLEHFAEVAEHYQRRTRFLEDLALDPIELSARENEAPESDEPPLVLSTIHSAKGLEFHTVFIIQAVEGNLPSRHAFGTPAALDEELRLLYVAATRAKEELFISYPSVRYRRGRGRTLTDPSRFLDGLSEDVLEPVTLVEEHEQPDQIEESVDG
ncbi:MAG: ATP-dependent helicase [Bacteroidetes bacterium QS_8_68_15]|nr:MAG: ATP-dependent helicase [Bacteroidetes bacterium QS_8_68_15]